MPFKQLTVRHSLHTSDHRICPDTRLYKHSVLSLAHKYHVHIDTSLHSSYHRTRVGKAHYNVDQPNLKWDLIYFRKLINLKKSQCLEVNIWGKADVSNKNEPRLCLLLNYLTVHHIRHVIITGPKLTITAEITHIKHGQWCVHVF